MESSKPVSRIAELRQQKGLTQLQIAEILGVTENTIANWEKGRSGLDWIIRITNLCMILACKPEELLQFLGEGNFFGDRNEKERPSFPWPSNDPVIPIEGEAVVDQPIPPYGQGRVYYRGSWWPATSIEETTLLKGQCVRVVERQNITLLVTPICSEINLKQKMNNDRTLSKSCS
ncbi:MAG: helix-turn-helix domain-containing protein [Roseofilum sp. SBFL]|uniref:NfeD family protein n=1 Tax=unclassified Roseofilum TaxID=2620099 RepID=UPI001B050392|nr:MULTISPECIES: NfeD family protein [unclassified Roseofilum]MBP0012111.1 helix-turn-helix domain-containing protein [Roseofilum sp. SID3]MBP0023915.1 helix-turn-helix domain-containing protein [Roseofilum sp. SID2]MBP0039537.1 helix-turn-helix domain-containing protein [Roseofilum sp. SID1]MBP0044445.1 helix-turn-helix domain-containing protein [Roseofilum sp. SBFL]